MRAKNRRTFFTAVPCFLLSVSLTTVFDANAQSTTQPSQETKRPVAADRKSRILRLPDNRVDPAIENPEGLELTLTDQMMVSETDLNAVRLVVDEVMVKRSEELPQMLESGGIKWGARAISLIYDLNPTLVDVRAVPEQTILNLPKITGDSLLDQLKAAGPIVILSAREQTPNKVAQAKQKTLGDLSKLLRKIPNFHFRKLEVKTTLIQLVDSARRSLSFLGDNQSSASQKVVAQSAFEAARLDDLIRAGLSANRVGDKQIQKEATDLSRSIVDRANEVKAGGSALALIEVHTVTKNGRPIPGLRVFYRPKLDETEKYVEKFRSPSTPTSEALAVGATFVLWAGEGDNPHPVSDHQTVTINSKINYPVKLVIQE